MALHRDFLGQPPTLTGPQSHTGDREPAARSLRRPTNFVIITFGITPPSASTPRTFECAIWTTCFSHSGPHVHSPILLGTFCLPSFARPSYITILASIPHYTSGITFQATFTTQCSYTHGTAIFAPSTWTSSIRPE